MDGPILVERRAGLQASVVNWSRRWRWSARHDGRPRREPISGVEVPINRFYDRIAMAAGKKHKLGFANGSIIEYPDGTAGYVPNMSFSQAFRVKIADVTGFSVTKGSKMLERQVNVLGNGTLLGAASVPHGTAEVIERWFRSHPDFGKSGATGAEPTGTGAGASVADEIKKLAGLRETGALTDEEFAAAKHRLLESL